MKKYVIEIVSEYNAPGDYIGKTVTEYFGRNNKCQRAVERFSKDDLFDALDDAKLSDQMQNPRHWMWECGEPCYWSLLSANVIEV